MSTPTGDDEVLIAHVHRHHKGLVIPILVFAAIVGVATFCWGRFEAQQYRLWTLGVAALMTAALVLLPMVVRSSTTLTLTDRRAIVRSGVLRRRRVDLIHGRYGAVTISQSIWQRLWGAGDLEFAEGKGTFGIRDVPDAKLLQAACQQLSIRAAPEVLGQSSQVWPLPGGPEGSNPRAAQDPRN